MNYDPKKILIVHYGTEVSLITTDKKKAKKICKEKKKQWPILDWRVTTLDDFPHYCWEQGVENEMENQR